MVMIVIVQVLVPKVVDENVPDLVVRLHLLCQVDDTVFDDVSIDATDVIRLIAPENRIVAVQAVHLELAQLVGFNHLAPVLYESIFDWEVDSKLAVCLVIEVTPIPLDLVQVCVPTLLEDVNCVVGNLDLLAANELHGRVGILVASGVHKMLLVGGNFTLGQVVR